jgi:predicted ATP-grasp superfamily ATP-dependent carboligase
MKLFVYEHITSGALADQNLTISLADEGDKMLLAALQDCHETQRCTLITIRDDRLSPLDLFEQNPQYHYHQITTLTDYHHAWVHCLTECQAILIIAPETDNVLATLQQLAIDAGKIILGSHPSAIQATTNKLECYQHLLKSNISTIPTYLASEWLKEDHYNQSGYILKPIDGAGCIETYLFETAAELKTHLATQDASDLNRQVIQPFYKGTDLSFCLLASHNTIEILSINLQHITQKYGQFNLSACTVNINNRTLPTLAQADQVAQQIKAAFPGLFGFIGLDLIHNDNGLYIVDINPRLTTSYIALKSSLNLNPMARLFDIIEHKKTIFSPITHRKKIEVIL